ARLTFLAASTGTVGSRAAGGMGLEPNPLSGQMAQTIGSDIGRISTAVAMSGRVVVVIGLSTLLWRERRQVRRLAGERDALTRELMGLKSLLAASDARAGSSDRSSDHKPGQSEEFAQAMSHRLGGALSTVSSLLALQA